MWFLYSRKALINKYVEMKKEVLIKANEAVAHVNSSMTDMEYIEKDEKVVDFNSESIDELLTDAIEYLRDESTPKKVIYLMVKQMKLFKKSEQIKAKIDKIW